MVILVKTTTTNVPNPTPLQTALGIGSTLAGIYSGLGKPQTKDLDRYKMNRVLKRPMFKMGGSTGTGITSGLDRPRQQIIKLVCKSI